MRICQLLTEFCLAEPARSVRYRTQVTESVRCVQFWSHRLAPLHPNINHRNNIWERHCATAIRRIESG